MTDEERDLDEWPLGPRVTEARGSESARSVARRAGISPELLWQIENGRRRDDRPWNRPTAPNIQAVARAVGIPEAEALELAGYNPDHYITPVDDGPALMSEAVLAKKIQGLDVPDRRAVEKIVESLERRRDLEEQVDRALRAGGFIAPDAPRPGEVENEERPDVPAGRGGRVRASARSEFGDPPVVAPDQVSR
jgi:transcriptional regulator with XRE-family HTH domain